MPCMISSPNRQIDGGKSGVDGGFEFALIAFGLRQAQKQFKLLSIGGLFRQRGLNMLLRLRPVSCFQVTLSLYSIEIALPMPLLHVGRGPFRYPDPDSEDSRDAEHGCLHG